MIKNSALKQSMTNYHFVWPNNLVAEETILPKPQPKIEKLPKKEIILPKTQPKTDELQKEEIPSDTPQEIWDLIQEQNAKKGHK